MHKDICVLCNELVYNNELKPANEEVATRTLKVSEEKWNKYQGNLRSQGKEWILEVSERNERALMKTRIRATTNYISFAHSPPPAPFKICTSAGHQPTEPRNLLEHGPPRNFAREENGEERRRRGREEEDQPERG